MAELPTEEDQVLWDQYIGPNGVPRISISAPVAEQPLPSEPTEFDNDPFVRAAERLRRRHQQFPVYGPPAPEKQPSYLIEPDLLEAQQGQHLPTNMAYNDAGIPFNVNTGVEIPTIRRPNILPVASTPEGPTFAMPKAMDVFGNLMGGVAGAPVKGAEVLLGSGPVRKVVEASATPVTTGPFFSALETAVDTAKLGKASADQWLGYLKNQPGVKQEELATVLGDIKGTLTKEQLGEIVKANKVELKEVVKGNKLTSEQEEWLELAANRRLDEDELKKFSELEAIKQSGEMNKTNTKYHSYQLPGGENYKEMLLTLPNSWEKFRELQKTNDARIATLRQEMHGTSGTNEIRVEISKLQKENQSLQKQIREASIFKSSHWDEPNIIAHVRHNDRMIDGKKTLHLEEIQSDWHQKGRSEGYKLSDKQRADLENIEGKLTSKLTEAEIGNPDIDNVLKVAVDKKVITPDEAKNYKDYVKGENSTVPDAPFKKNWDELALKRMLHKAATEGYDAISWTPGEAQAARYDLSKQVENIQWKPEHGNRLVEINPKGGKQIGVYVDKEGKVVPNDGYDVHAKPYEGKPLADIVGKEIAEKIMTGDKGELSGEGLKIGGEGMKSFYDKMLVDKANALAKKYGSKVEQRDLNTGLKDDGLNTKLKDNGYDPNNVDIQEILTDNGGRLPFWLSEDELKLIESGENVAAHNLDQKMKGRAAQPIHYLPITPELRAKAKEGFPLFSTSPTLTAVQHDPFAEENKKFKLTPVNHDPFN